MSKRLAIALGFLALSFTDLGAQTKSTMFVYQNNFWLNLHQFLRGELYRRGAKLPLGVDPSSLNESDRAAWESTIDVYKDVAKGDLVFDDNEQKITNTLAINGDAVRLADGLLDARTLDALNAAAPIYRARLWPSRQRDNEAWLTALKVLVDQHGEAMRAALSKVYGLSWPREPYLVSAVGEIGPNSAVTHQGPRGYAALIQPSTSSARNTGDAPLELIYHESSHVAQVGVRITKMIADECTRQKLSVLPNLWHAVIMYTSGAVAKRELEATGHPGYVPYVYRYNQLTPIEQKALEQDWQPYLDGKSSLKQALHDLVRDAR